jgi:Uma2 family endonuclease
MAMRSRVQFLAEDIWDTPDDGNRYEVIDGELYVSPPPTFGHQLAVMRLSARLEWYVTERRLGYVLTAPLGVALDPTSGVQPDIVFISQGRSGNISDRGLEGAPDLAVEVLSPGTASRDRGVKMRRYAAAGIDHYWIVDPRRRTLEAFELRDDGYAQVAAYEAGDVFRPTLFPGLEIALSDLWR